MEDFRTCIRQCRRVGEWISSISKDARSAGDSSLNATHRIFENHGILTLMFHGCCCRNEYVRMRFATPNGKYEEFKSLVAD